MRPIYMDHAATSFPKPPSVIRAVQRCMAEIGGNPGRGAHKLAREAAEIVYSCREEAANMFDLSPERVVFTGGATQAINMAIQGLVRPGDHVLVSSLSHNAVYRPVYALAAAGTITMDVYPAGQGWEKATERLCTPHTRMLIATHASNICSMTEPLLSLSRFCAQRGILLVVDGAQSGGHLPIQVDKMQIAALCLPGHKGLSGPQGVGMLLIGKDTPPLTPILTGGSGVHSSDPNMPDVLPEHLEAGTLPTPAIAGLLEGLRFSYKEGPSIHKEAESLGNLFVNEAKNIPGFQVYGKAGSVVSFHIDGISPASIATSLDKHGIYVRSGFHCAPLAHRYIGTPEHGTVRVSFGYGNRAEDVYKLLDALTTMHV